MKNLISERLLSKDYHAGRAGPGGSPSGQAAVAVSSILPVLAKWKVVANDATQGELWVSKRRNILRLQRSDSPLGWPISITLTL